MTQIVPFEMVDAALAECGAVEQRLRKLPARVVVYLLLAAALVEECGYPAVCAGLTSALHCLPVPKVTATALWHARARLGVRPVRALFGLLRGPASAIRTTGACWAGLLGVAVDGTCLDVPDNPATRTHLGKGSLLDHRRYPAFEPVKLYHERWEVESAFFAIKKFMLGRRVLRARTVFGIAQEVYALLTAYRLIRIAIADATATLPGTDPDRAGFSIALQTARGQVIQAAGVIADTTIDLVGTIRTSRPEPADDSTTTPRQSPRRQATTVPIRVQEPARGPTHLQGHHQHRHPVDRTHQPITSRPCP
ncbi:transposase domain-containing protein [Streptomyces sp. NPDC004609]|uniref:transposase domain-containing protein n=1 Tax=Streptomyces sp. NPDC004609 TaxID=3364704 RepID=UPI00367824DC